MGVIIGIDLGTTYSAAALFDEFGRPDILANRDGHRLIPSAVAMIDGELQVGEEARKHIALHPDEGAMRFKRYMGTRNIFNINGRAYSPTSLSAQVLAHIKDYVSHRTSDSRIDSIVITVPANFSNDAREATLEAAQKAGLKVEYIIDEPTAAVLYYVHNSPNKLRGTYAVYDLGGGTFDISIVSIEDKNITVKVSNGIAELGGIDFDDKLQALFRRKYELQSGQEIEDKHIHRLFDLVRIEEAKRSLSKRGDVDRFIEGELVEVTRGEFESEIQGYVDQAETCCQATLKEAGLEASDLAGVILAGGSTRVPLVRQSIERVFECDPIALVNVDEVVALGAAFYAAYRCDRALLTPAQIAVLGDLFMQEVSNMHFGVNVVVENAKRELERRNSIIIRKNTQIPCEVARTYYTVADGQRSVLCKVNECSREETNLDYVTIIGKVELSLPAGRPAHQELKVTYKYDENQILHCSVRDVESGEHRRVSIQKGKSVN